MKDLENHVKVMEDYVKDMENHVRVIENHVKDMEDPQKNGMDAGGNCRV